MVVLMSNTVENWEIEKYIIDILIWMCLIISEMETFPCVYWHFVFCGCVWEGEQEREI